MNLSRHADPIITKRLSSSSATLLHSPDRGNADEPFAQAAILFMPLFICDDGPPLTEPLFVSVVSLVVSPLVVSLTVTHEKRKH